MTNQHPLTVRESRVVKLWFEPDYKPDATWYTAEHAWRMAGGLEVPVSKLQGLHLFNCWRMCRRLVVAAFETLSTRRGCQLVDFVAMRIRLIMWWEKILLAELNRRALEGDPAMREVAKLLKGGTEDGPNRLGVD